MTIIDELRRQFPSSMFEVEMGFPWILYPCISEYPTQTDKQRKQMQQQSKIDSWQGYWVECPTWRQYGTND